MPVPNSPACCRHWHIDFSDKGSELAPLCGVAGQRVSRCSFRMGIASRRGRKLARSRCSFTSGIAKRRGRVELDAHAELAGLLLAGVGIEVVGGAALEL